MSELDRLDAESTGADPARIEGLRAERAVMRRTLDLVDDLTYGVCEICHGFIGIDRLMALPSATRCITCAR